MKQIKLIMLQKRKIPVCVHVILGLPGETRQEMLETVKILLDLGVEGIKFHHLHILKGSFLEQEYDEGRIHLFKMDDYVQLIRDMIGLISGRMVIHRFMGEAHKSQLVAPQWTNRKREVLAAICQDL